MEIQYVDLETGEVKTIDWPVGSIRCFAGKHYNEIGKVEGVSVVGVYRYAKAKFCIEGTYVEKSSKHDLINYRSFAADTKHVQNLLGSKEPVFIEIKRQRFEQVLKKLVGAMFLKSIAVNATTYFDATEKKEN